MTFSWIPGVTTLLKVLREAVSFVRELFKRQPKPNLPEKAAKKREVRRTSIKEITIKETRTEIIEIIE